MPSARGWWWRWSVAWLVAWMALAERPPPACALSTPALASVAARLACDALEPVLDERTRADPEKQVKKWLRRHYHVLPDADRATFSRLVLGVAVQRRRLRYLLACSGVAVPRPVEGLVALHVLDELHQYEYQRHAHDHDHEGKTNKPDPGPGPGPFILPSSVLLAGLTNLTAADRTGLARAVREATWPANPVERLQHERSLPTWLAAAWVAQYGFPTADALAAACNVRGPVVLRPNAARCPSVPALAARLEAEHGLTGRVGALSGGLLLDRKPPTVWGLQAWLDGWFEVQDEGSQCIAQACRVGGAGDQVIVDLCAGNGGKTLALASDLARNGHDPPGTILAFDVDTARLRQLEGARVRTGTAGVVEPMFSLQQLHARLAQLRPDDGPGGGRADVVLVDAPCSSTGALRRRPGQRWAVEPDDARRTLPALQRELLGQAAGLVQPGGGRLVYATCSLLAWENQEVAAWFEARPGFDDEWVPWPFDRAGDGDDPPHWWSILPHVHGSDGFFIARWRRR